MRNMQSSTSVASSEIFPSAGSLTWRAQRLRARLLEGLAVEGVGGNVADGDAGAAEALDVGRDLLLLVQVHERNF